MYCKEKDSLAIQAVADYLLGVSLVLGPGVSSNLLRLLVCLLLLIGRLLVGRSLWLLRLLEGLLLEGGLLVSWLDGLLGSWLVVSLLSAWLLLVGRGRPLLLNLQGVADNVAEADNDAAATAAAALSPAGSSGTDSSGEQLLLALPSASASSQ